MTKGTALRHAILKRDSYRDMPSGMPPRTVNSPLDFRRLPAATAKPRRLSPYLIVALWAALPKVAAAKLPFSVPSVATSSKPDLFPNCTITAMRIKPGRSAKVAAEN